MIQETLRSALQKHQQGDLAGASSLYLRVLEYDPNNVDALGLMSIIAKDAGDNGTAINLASKALELKPNRVELYINLANPLIAEKRIDEAITTLEKAIKVDRRSVDVLSTLGDAYQEKKEYKTAIEFYHKGLRLDRSDPILYNNLGNALNKSGNQKSAIEYFQKAISLKPDYAEAHYNLGTAHQVLKQTDEAIESFTSALKINPKLHLASKSLGMLYYAQSKTNQAMEAFREALANNPNPKENYDVLICMGDLSKNNAKYEAAEDCYRVALKLQNTSLARLGLASTLISLNRIEEAHEFLDQLIAEEPTNLEYQLSKVISIPILYPSVEAINTSRQAVEEGLKNLLDFPNESKIKAIPFFYLSYHGRNDRTIMEALATLIHKHIEPIEGIPQIWNYKPKIGFISKFLSKTHTIGKLNHGIIQNISRDLFDVVVFSVGNSMPYTQSDSDNPSDVFITLPDQDIKAAQNTILDENIDILFYTDIGMDDITFSLAHSRLAKVQCVTWGHPATTGLKTIDYFISSKLLEIENAQEHYTEELVLLENLPTVYSRPPLIESDQVRSVLGLSETDTLYICPQSIFKLHPEFDGILAQILNRDPNGKLVLINAESANQDILKRFQDNSSGIADRIVFAPRLLWQDFLILLASADVMLDPIHFGGGNTTFEALAFCTPIVTMPSQFMRGRVTYGCYQKMGYLELVANTPEEYVDIAVRLGIDPKYREQVKDQIANHNHALYNNHEIVLELEGFFLNALEKVKAKQGDSDA